VDNVRIERYSVIKQKDEMISGGKTSENTVTGGKLVGMVSRSWC